MDELVTRKVGSKTPILSLVDREYRKSVANINRKSNEAISYLYAEADGAIQRATAAKDIPEWVRAAIIQKRLNFIRWLDEILITSQSVDALRSWQMVRGLENPQGGQQRPSGAVMPDFNQPQPPGQERKRNGVLKRGGAA